VRWEPPAAAAAARPRREGVDDEGLGGLSAMMVLLLKQTHLQKEVAEAVACAVAWLAGRSGVSES
jgi:hypothetical protein